MLICNLFYFGFARNKVMPRNMNAPLGIMDNSMDSLALNQKEKKLVHETKGLDTVISSSQAPAPIPKEYDVAQEFRTYQIDGKWLWDETFEQAMQHKTGWRKEKNGNYVITVNYAESFKTMSDEIERKFVYAGGDIEIAVNGNLCCCNGIIAIPKGIAGKNISDVKNKIQNAITMLLLQNKTVVIEKIKGCL